MGRRVRPVLRRTRTKLAVHGHHAEDQSPHSRYVTQAALLKLYLAWPRLARHDLLDAYARKIVLRTFLSEHRRSWRKRERLTDEPPELTAEQPGTEHDMLVRHALAGVAPKQRAVLVLRYFNDLSVEETAAALGCSTGTVKSQSARGLDTCASD